MFQMENPFKASLLQIKKQQWAKEREEASEEWSPWGRPGGGAPIKPIKTPSSQLENRQPPQDKNNRTVLPPLPPSGTNVNSANNAIVGGRVSATPRESHHQPSSSRKNVRHLKVSLGADVEGETSGYHSDNAADDEKTTADHWRSVSRNGRPSAGPKAANSYKLVERRKWVQDPPQSPSGDPNGYLGNYAGGGHLQALEHLPQINRQRHMAPPRWVERSTSANIQLGHVSERTEPRLPPVPCQEPVDRPERQPSSSNDECDDRHFDNADWTDGGGFYEPHAGDPVHSVAMRATTTASNFLRGQNVPVDAWILAEREMKRRQAVELQRALLQQLAEKESKRQIERERMQEEERRQEEQLRRQLDQEKVHYEEEQKKIKEKKEQEQKRLEAVHSAMLNAQQNALAEKIAKRKQSSCSKEVSAGDQPQVGANASCAPTPRVSIPIPMVRLVDAQIQTESPPSDSNHACHCEKSRLKLETHRQGGTDNSSSDRAVTDTSTGQQRHKSRSSNLNSRPQWGSHQSSHKYMTNSEKDPRFLKRRRERLRRRQRAFLEKQLHGSWPSSESSGSREEVFFPFLPSAHSPVERCYEGHQTTLAHIMPSISNYGSMKSPYSQTKISVCREDYMEPLQLQPCRPATTIVSSPTVDRCASPPVPALLKKIRLANGESVAEKHEWEDYEEKEKDDGHKVSKDFENLKIRENQGEESPPATGDPDREKQDLLFRLSLLKRGLEQKKTAMDDQVSIISSTIP